VTTRARVGSIVAGKYKLIEHLGGGGMGDVFRAEHQYAGRMVALKLLRPDFADDEDLTRRFFQEAQAVNRIRHPNIVDVLDAGFAAEGPYVVMEVLEGASLSAALSLAGRFSLAAALAVLFPVLDALEAVHRQGIVHRDLKPENIFLARTMAGVTVKLVDFGIAKVLDASTKTNTGVVFGTPDYLSPEQASGDGSVDGRSDVFAVAIVLFQLLTGRRPFEAETPLATAYKIVNVPAPPLASLEVSVDPRVQQALDVALAKSPNERFASAATFAGALAPMAPEMSVRRAALVQVVDAVAGSAPTAAPAMLALASFSEYAPFDDTARRRAMETPVVPVTPSPRPPPPFPAARAAPTLASNRVSMGKPYAQVPPLEGRGETDSSAGPRLPSASPTERAIPPRTELHELRENLPSSPRATLPSVPTPSPRKAPPLSLTPSPSPTRLSNVPVPTPRGVAATTPPRAAPGSTTGVARSSGRSMPWTPRALPAHVRGKCHARGSVPRAACRWIERAYGKDAKDEILRALPAEVAQEYRSDGFNSLVWYDLSILDLFLEAATALVLGGDVVTWRSLARENFELDLGPIFRPASARPAEDPTTLLKRSISAWARLYDFATARVIESSGAGAPSTRVLMRFDGFDAASLAVRNTTIGTAEGLVRKGAGTGEIASRVLTGEASFVRDFEFELSWPARP